MGSLLMPALTHSNIPGIVVNVKAVTDANSLSHHNTYICEYASPISRRGRYL
jgi:hypothetical protein